MEGFSTVPEILCCPNAKLDKKGKKREKKTLYKKQIAAGFLNITKQNK